jgi:DNA-binding FrmR family transcriptional regulator
MLCKTRFLSSLYFMADKAAGGGGDKPATVPELTQRVADLEAERNTLQTKLTAAEGQVTALQGEKATLQTKLTAAEGQVTALQGEKATLQTKLTDAEGQVTTLKATQKSAEQIAREDSARHGAAPSAKTPPEAQAGGDAASWDEYLKADAVTQATMRKEKGAELQKAAKAWDAAQKK